jgi:HD-GYP domain-containing protein (c-di-GMP phosphodiesterase class II)
MKHPFHTVAMLEQLPGLPPAVPLVAYQVHERADAMGYPRRRHPNTVHAFAKIVAVADVYTAMISPRPWREPKQTYDTMVELLTLTSTGRFDRDVMRALVERLGLFPVGSVVILNTGLQCIVRRANSTSFVKPIVEVIGPPGHKRFGEMVDLSDWAHLEVVRCQTLEEFAADETAPAAETANGR